MQFDLNLVRSLVTLASFAFFVAIWIWAYSRRNRNAFDEAARLPFEEGEDVEAVVADAEKARP